MCMEEDALQHESMNQENRQQESHNSRVQHLLNLMKKNKIQQKSQNLILSTYEYTNM